MRDWDTEQLSFSTHTKKKAWLTQHTVLLHCSKGSQQKISVASVAVLGWGESRAEDKAWAKFVHPDKKPAFHPTNASSPSEYSLGNSQLPLADLPCFVRIKTTKVTINKLNRKRGRGGCILTHKHSPLHTNGIQLHLTLASKPTFHFAASRVPLKFFTELNAGEWCDMPQYTQL